MTLSIVVSIEIQDMLSIFIASSMSAILLNQYNKHLDRSILWPCSYYVAGLVPWDGLVDIMIQLPFMATPSNITSSSLNVAV